MSRSPALPEEEARIALSVLRHACPTPADVWMIGSRARGDHRRGSDLDLLVDAGRPLTAQELFKLRAAFEASMLSYFVDVVDVRTIDGIFAENARRDRVPFVTLP